MTTAWNEDQLYSSKKQDWETPQALFDALHDEFDFGLDAAATAENAKCFRFIEEDSHPEGSTVEDDIYGNVGALHADWASLGSWVGRSTQAVWLNPPYGKDIGKWIEKAYRDYGHDIDNPDTPLEAGLQYFVDFDKPGGFIGKHK